MRSRLVRSVPLLAVAALAVVACSGDDDAETSAATSEAEPSLDVSTTEPSATTEPTVPSTTDGDASETTVPVTTAVPETTAPPTTTPTSTEPPVERDFTEVAQTVETWVDTRGLNGAGLIVVDADDGVVYEDYWGEFSADRISLVASSSKMVTAGVLMRLHDEGLLDVDAPVADVAAWGAGNPGITPAQLVSNSSGLVGLIPDPGYAPYVCQFLPTGDIQSCTEGIFTTPDDDADIVAPDTEYRYGGAQWQVAGAVAEVASGQSWADLFHETYVEPCGLEASGYNNHWTQLGPGGFDYPTEFNGDPSLLQPTDNPNMEGGLYTTTGDYAKLLLMHLRGGECDNGQVMSSEAIDRMHADRIAEAYDGSAGADTGYGMGWWIDRASGRLTDPGAYGAVPWLDLADGYGAYLVVEATGEQGSGLAALLYDPVDAAMNGS